MSKCGAKTKAGGKCERNAMENGKCHYHGGKSTGPPPGTQNNLKHGIYSSVLEEDEKALWDDVRVGNLEHEIRLTKLQLVRSVKFNKDHTDNPRQDITERLLRTIANLEKTHKEITQEADPDEEQEPYNIKIEVVDGRKPSSE